MKKYIDDFICLNLGLKVIFFASLFFDVCAIIWFDFLLGQIKSNPGPYSFLIAIFVQLNMVMVYVIYGIIRDVSLDNKYKRRNDKA